MDNPSGWNGSMQDLRTRFLRLAEAKDFLSRQASDAEKELAEFADEKENGGITEIDRVQSLLGEVKSNLQRMNLEMAELQHLIFHPAATVGVAKL